MLEIRIHGRGGQGNVVAAYLLATAAIERGRYAQAFPAFGAERRGAPVVAFTRIAGRPIKRRCQVLRPAFLIIQDQALLGVEGVTDGLNERGAILVNTTKDAAAISEGTGVPVVALPATGLANEILGRPVPNTALLAAFLSLTGLLPVEALIQSLSHRFKGKVLEKNTQLIEAAAEQVTAGQWEEIARATGS
jgi:pyruvate ferredoxin oxidoreductase gamma subunit